MNNDKIIIDKLEELVKEGNSIGNTTRHVNETTIKKFQISAKNLIQVRFRVNSTYYKDLIKTYKIKCGIYETSTDFSKRLIRLQTGVLEAILDAMQNGLIDDLFYQNELLVFSDLLDQAFEFLEKNLNFAAGIYGRIVLETTIKEFAKKYDIDSELRFDRIIIELRQKGLIEKPFENSLRANYEIGSWAAHGNAKFNEMSKSDVNEFLVFIRDKVLIIN